MKKRRCKELFFLIVASLILLPPDAGGQSVLKDKGSSRQLYVEGEPYLIIGGQVHNSATGSAEYFDRVLSKLGQMHINTVVAPVSWELFEPEEGKYDYSQLEHVILTARKHKLKLVLIWFGSWKNGTSQYAPAWVRQDSHRFPMALDEKYEKTSALSCFGSAAMEADKKAFSLVMEHIRKMDSKEQTVIMVQINNEVGLFASRDHLPEANQAFRSDVPAELMKYLETNRNTLADHLAGLWAEKGYKMSGSWEDIFGGSESCHELFMAWHYARYMGEMAAAGKKIYALPMFVNAWLAGNALPGKYPSGGPVHKVIDIWKAAAPDIDLYAPDLYGSGFKSVCRKYHRADNPLFIPETNGDVWFRPEPQNVHQSSRNVFWAFGEHDALGFCPFGLEGLPVSGPLTDSYSLLGQLSPLILEYQGTGRMRGILQNDETMISSQRENGVMEVLQAETNTILEFEDYVARINYVNTDSLDRSYGLIIHTGKDEFLIAGHGLLATFTNRGSGTKAGFAEIWEQLYRDGEFVNGRRLNGDESNQGSAAQIPFCSFDNFDKDAGPRVL